MENTITQEFVNPTIYPDDLVKYILENEQEDLDSVGDYLEERYQGEWKNLEDWAQNFLEETGMFEGVSDMIKRYFDYASYGRDAQWSGDIWTIESENNEIYVLWNH